MLTFVVQSLFVDLILVLMWSGDAIAFYGFNFIAFLCIIHALSALVL